MSPPRCRLRGPLAMLLAAALTLAAVPAGAKETARTHYRRGLSAYALGRYGDAAREYEHAFELTPDPALLYNAAQAHRLAGNKERALALYQSFVAVFEGDPAHRAAAERHIAALKRALAGEREAEATEAAGAEAAPAPGNAVEPQPTRPEAAALTAGAVERPWYRKGWVWGVIAGSVVVVGTGIGLGVAFGAGKHDPAPTWGSLVAR